MLLVQVFDEESVITHEEDLYTVYLGHYKV